MALWANCKVSGCQWHAEVGKLSFANWRCIVLCLQRYESPWRAAVICSRGRLHSTTHPPLPSLFASIRNEVKEFNLDLPLFWLPWRRHAARLDAAAVFFPISKRTAKAQTETVRKSGTDTTWMLAVSRLHPSSHCAQPERWRDAESPMAWAEGCQYKHVHYAYTCVHAHTLVYLLPGTVVSSHFWGARERAGCVLLGGRMIYGDLYRHQGMGPMGSVTAPLSVSVNSPRNHISPSLEGNRIGTVAASPALLPGSVWQTLPDNRAPLLLSRLSSPQLLPSAALGPSYCSPLCLSLNHTSTWSPPS